MKRNVLVFLPLCLLTLLSGFALLACAPQAAQSVRTSLVLCAEVLIPSLFPFLVFASFLSASGLASLLARPFGGLTERLLHLPRSTASTVLLSFLGGYPTGALLIAGHLRRGEIDPPTAARMLCFCVNPSPAFVLSAVGGSLLGDRALGARILLCCFAVNLLLGVAVSLPARLPGASPPAAAQPPLTAFVEAVSGSAQSMLTVCAFTVLFPAVYTALTRLLPPLGGADGWLRGILEVSGGCAANPDPAACAGFVAFGGLCVLAQIAALLRAYAVRLAPMLLCRAVAGVACFLLLRHTAPRAVSAFSNLARPVSELSPLSLTLTALLLALAVLCTAARKNG